MKVGSEIFKALSEPIRLRIMVLLTRGELCVCDLMEVLGLPQSTVSRHMARLRQAGLVADRRNGKWVHYRLSEADSMIVTGVQHLLRGMADEPPHSEDLQRLKTHQKSQQQC